MPLSADDMCGKNADGSICFDYCKYCYNEGEFTQQCTMDEMIDHCSEFVDEFNKHAEQPITREQYKEMMYGFFPMLKRWKNEK
ncbi:MAG: zinc ribbon domain-containing protein [Muribaculaceae bacterium]|nr:zinc ribbon domain-containing protein [Muribaculaceae bacterium]